MLHGPLITIVTKYKKCLIIIDLNTIVHKVVHSKLYNIVMVNRQNNLNH